MPAAGARILVIEDNPTNLHLMSYLLESFGHKVATAEEGEEGLRAAHRDEPDLIVCDLQLPGMDGFEIARRMKAHPVLRGIPLLAVTAYAMVGDREKVLAAGFDGYISKPIEPESFVSQVTSFLRPPPVPIFHEIQPAASRAIPVRETLLAVDDSPAALDLIRSTFEPFGYVVITAGGLEEGLAVARERRPDLILSDLHMTNGDGRAFIRAVKADPGLRDIPFVFISSTFWPSRDRSAALELGAEMFIVRPIEPHDLVARIDECLKRRGGN